MAWLLELQDFSVRDEAGAVSNGWSFMHCPVCPIFILGVQWEVVQKGCASSSVQNGLEGIRWEAGVQSEWLVES